MENKIIVTWHDARLISPSSRAVGLSTMETIGIFFKETDDYLVIKDPITKHLETGEPHPQKQPTFYYIPKGMIVSRN